MEGSEPLMPLGACHVGRYGRCLPKTTEGMADESKGIVKVMHITVMMTEGSMMTFQIHRWCSDDN